MRIKKDKDKTKAKAELAINLKHSLIEKNYKRMLNVDLIALKKKIIVWSNN